MLKTIDKYIIKKYLVTFFFTALLFTLIAVIIDFSERIDDFLAESELTVNQIIFEYYLNWIPFMSGLLFPLYALISVIFFTSRMAANSEIISILNSGASFSRILRPYLIAAFVIASIHFVAKHYIIPLGNKSKVKFENKYIAKHDRDSKTQNIHIFLDPTHKIYIRNYSKLDSLATEVSLEHIENGELKSKLNARSAKWDGKKGKWTLKNYSVRTIDGLKETYKEGDNLDTLINLTPHDLERRDNLKTTMPTLELMAFIKNERTRGAGTYVSYQVEQHTRTTEPFSIFILTCIGMTLAARKIRGGMGLNLALGAGIGALFIVATRFSMTLSTNAGMHPALGAWMPNIIFSLITIYIIRKAQK